MDITENNPKNTIKSALNYSFRWYHISQACSVVLQHVQQELTDVRHFGHSGRVDVFGEPRLVVVDVVDLDDELGLALQRLVGEAVDGLGVEDVVGLLLPVQPLGGVDVPRLLVYLEEGPRALPREDVPHAPVASVAVRVKLRREKDEKT